VLFALAERRPSAAMPTTLNAGTGLAGCLISDHGF